MTQKIMTKYKIAVIEYDPSGYYFPKYKTVQTVITETLEEAKEKAIERSPWQHNFGAGWAKRASVISSEDIVMEDNK